ncbi:hypothetical protein [Streptomyces sp. 12257]|nr:hypothetical protein [Streptomyces sp. 12257]MDI5910421.1 hypothetical protein [Streptomyces sp. 12257]
MSLAPLPLPCGAGADGLKSVNRPTSPVGTTTTPFDMVVRNDLDRW